MKTRNSHCTPSSFEERTFKRNRIITLIFVGITIVSVAIMFVCSYYMHGRHFFHHHPYDLYADSFMFFKTTLCICALVLLVSLPASWIMLSFMAFRQLPNPRGYKIYNISCHVIAWISLIISFVLTWKLEPMANTFAIIALITFCAFYATQTIRVISYSLPKGIDKLKGIELKAGTIIPNGQTENPEDNEEHISEKRRICPYCGGRKDKFDLLCYYNNEGIIWSDFRHMMPQVAVPSLIQKCPHCGKYYISKGSHVLIKDTADFEFIDPVSWNYFKQSYEEYSQLDKDKVIDYNHRLRILGAYNDEFNRPQNPPVPTEQDIMLFKDNMLHLMEYFSDPIDKAELYREMGLFDECFKQLEMVDDEGNESKRGYKEIIFDFAKKGSVRPFGWKEN